MSSLATKSPAPRHTGQTLRRRWRLHPDCALPPDPAVRSIARQIYAHVADLPIVSMHGHVEAAMLDANRQFGNPAEVLVVPDHYALRMLVSQGTPLSALGCPPADGAVETDPREIFCRFAEGWRCSTARRRATGWSRCSSRFSGSSSA